MSTPRPSTDSSFWPPPPPSDETAEVKSARLEAEAEARRVSDAIDHSIEQERQEQKKRKPAVKILLLGQAESGKSTTLKNFQLQFTPKAFQAETDVWSSVIRLNVLRSIVFIINRIAEKRTLSIPSSPVPTTFPPLGASSSTTLPNATSVVPDELRRLTLRLAPLRHVEAELGKRLQGDEPSSPDSAAAAARGFEVAVRGGSQWKKLLRSRAGSRSKPSDSKPDHILSETKQVMEACKDDMVELWNNQLVHDMLNKDGIELRSQAGFFLDDIARIAAKDYEPTTDDILRARIQTMGVEEHHLIIESDPEINGYEWIIYDCGGSRSQRATWASFFDHVNTIIFLAPVSAFDQYLSEDRSINRLEDSLGLWRQICSNKLLENIDIVLFLNKCDVLKTKLEVEGISFVSWVTSYPRTNANDYETVSRYIRGKFIAFHKQYSPKPRKLHVHMTTVTNSTATSAVLAQVRQQVLWENLKSSSFI